MWSMNDYSIIRSFEGNTASALNCRLLNYGTQLLTTAADGLLRLYTIRNAECENIFDVHEDRIWAIENITSSTLKPTTPTEESDDQQPAATNYILTGGSDSRLILWKDVTKEEELQGLVKAEETLVMEQRLYNYIAKKHYFKALSLALELNHATKLLQIFQKILDEEESKGSTSNGAGKEAADTTDAEDDDEEEFDDERDKQAYLNAKKRKNASNRSEESLFEAVWSKKFDPFVSDLKEDEKSRLILFLRDWNTNSKNAYLSQILLSSFMRTMTIDGLLAIKEWREGISGFAAYTERHYTRMNRLLQASHYINYIVSAINGFLPMDSYNPLATKSSSAAGLTDDSDLMVVGTRLIFAAGSAKTAPIEELEEVFEADNGEVESEVEAKAAPKLSNKKNSKRKLEAVVATEAAAATSEDDASEPEEESKKKTSKKAAKKAKVETSVKTAEATPAKAQKKSKK